MKKGTPSLGVPFLLRDESPNGLLDVVRDQHKVRCVLLRDRCVCKRTVRNAAQSGYRITRDEERVVLLW